MKLRLTIEIADTDLESVLTRLSGLAGGAPSNDAPVEIPTLLTVAETAEALRASRGQVYEMTKTGRLRSIRVGRRLMIPRNAIGWFIDDQLEGRETAPGEPPLASAQSQPTAAKASGNRPRRSRHRVSTDPISDLELAETTGAPIEEATKLLRDAPFEAREKDGRVWAERRTFVDWMKDNPEWDAWAERWF